MVRGFWGIDNLLFPLNALPPPLPWWRRTLGREVGSDGGRQYRWVGLVGGQVETRSYEILIPSEPRGRHALAVAVAEVKKGSWE